ncbi:MAG: hypothetical protein COT84_06140 [Chlamydiae bacterium CG10_big_fil_rev_8_21_14_0_10_35_9]|nr:MAG: hypothetical protein COT84_06140 [Chlamydiae bacterium CG10_big_fil_rev_8_21_14_0_10_35_9]
MINLVIFIVAVIFIVSLIFIQDWLYKHRRTARKDHEESPFITGPEDAMAHRVIDLGESKDQKPK